MTGGSLSLRLISTAAPFLGTQRIPVPGPQEKQWGPANLCQIKLAKLRQSLGYFRAPFPNLADESGEVCCEDEIASSNKRAQHSGCQQSLQGHSKDFRLFLSAAASAHRVSSHKPPPSSAHFMGTPKHREQRPWQIKALPIEP